jgi:outer membrane protein
MAEQGFNCKLIAVARIATTIGMVLALRMGVAQGLPASSPAVTIPPSILPGLSGAPSWALSMPAVAGTPADVSDGVPRELRGSMTSAAERPPHPGQIQRVTLEQVKQSATRAASPLARLSQLSVEAAKQHRLGVRADYFPKFGATFVNLHFTDFLGQVLTVRRPFLGNLTNFQPIPIAILNQNQTIAALSFVQPITPLLQVREAVRIARADERIAMAKAGAAVSKNRRDAEIEETYFKLLIAQRRLTSAEWRLRRIEGRPLYAAASVELVDAPGAASDPSDARKAAAAAAASVRELSESLNRSMGWPEDTKLELASPDPLVESISLDEVADKPAAPNPGLVEAEQTVVKAQAAYRLAKLAYVPTVAAVSGYLFQNAIPAVNSNFGYGGVLASYTLFDFGKREHAVKEAHAQLGMAEIGLQVAKARMAADVKKSYYDLERARQLSNVAQKMGSSAARLIQVSANPESLEVKAARADVEVEMLEAELAHRQAYARLTGLIGSPR